MLSNGMLSNGTNSTSISSSCPHVDRGGIQQTLCQWYALARPTTNPMQPSHKGSHPPFLPTLLQSRSSNVWLPW